MDKGCQRGESRIKSGQFDFNPFFVPLTISRRPLTRPVNISLKFELKCCEKEDCKKRDQGVLKPHKNKLN